jgi:YVTN family beta-propeller protein
MRLRLRIGRRRWIAAAALTCAGVAAGAGSAIIAVLHAGPQGDGTAITPIGWRVTPAGTQIRLQSGSIYADRPYGVAQSPDGQHVLISSDGQSTESLMLVNEATGAIEQAISYTSPNALFIGVIYSPDGKKAYASGGGQNVIHRYDVGSNGQLTGTSPITLPAGATRPFGDHGPYPAGLAISADGSTLFVANNIDNTMTRVDAATGAVLSTTPVGSNPYTVVLSKDGKTAYVSNWGGEQTFTPPATVTEQSRGSVSVIDTATGAFERNIQVGTHPSALAIDPATGDLYVANTDSDTVSVVDTATNAVVRTIDVAPLPSAPVGSNPDALAFTSDGQTLFVANSGNNDVLVVDLSKTAGPHDTDPILGAIPSAWYPTGLVVSKNDKRLFVVNGKGLGAGPNPNGPTPYHGSVPDQYSGSMLKATLSRVDLPRQINRGQFEQDSKQVADDTGFANKPLAGSFPSAIKHVIYVIKENRTYDQLFGDLSKGNGDPSLALFKDDSAPNQRALEQRFVTLDNVYAASEVSADGWEWSTAATANTYDQKTWPADYSSRDRGYDFEGGNFADAPGKDPENSYVWDRVLRAGISLRNYGFWVTGTVPAVVAPTEPELVPVTDAQYPGYNLNIRDQTRVAEWLHEFDQNKASNSLPTLEFVRLPNDHTAGTRPGSYSPRAMVADNDWALGKLVDAVSHSQFWPSTAIFVIEDDAQNGPDHVDAHRMPVQVISPYTQTGAVDSTFYSTVSVLKSIEQILGIGPLTQFDAAATPMTNAFSSTPNLAPYTAIKPDDSVLNEQNSVRSVMAAASAKLDLSRADAAPTGLLNAAIWKSVKGAKSVMPAPLHAGG